MGIHDGHRERLRNRFTEHGLDNFNELNALELLLFYAIPRRDTNGIAHALLDRFGSLSAVLMASQEELMDVEGIGDAASSLIRLVPQIMKLAAVSSAEKKKQIRKCSDAIEYLRPKFMYESNELFVVLFLDSQRNVIRCEELSRGTVRAVEVSIRRVVECALKYKASYVIVAHNHPEGNLINSTEDDYITKQMYKSLDMIDIKLLDHIIFGNGAELSYDRAGILNLIIR